MLIALLSDTHSLHAELSIPPVDLLIHTGDFTRRGSRKECLTFLDWFAVQPAKQRVLIAGNHDFWAAEEPNSFRQEASQRNIHYLENEEITLLGLRIWGSPVTPYFRGLAFNEHRGAPIRAYWDRIPTGLDLLLTHGPPHGILDRTFWGMNVGCEELRTIVLERAPHFHIFGHIHEDTGVFRMDGCPTEFHNVSRLRMPPSLGVRPAVLLSLPE